MARTKSAQSQTFFDEAECDNDGDQFLCARTPASSATAQRWRSSQRSRAVMPIFISSASSRCRKRCWVIFRPSSDMGPPGTGMSLWIACDDADGLHHLVVRHPGKILGALADGPFGRVFAAADPHGYAITFHTARGGASPSASYRQLPAGTVRPDDNAVLTWRARLLGEYSIQRLDALPDIDKACDAPPEQGMSPT